MDARRKGDAKVFGFGYLAGFVTWGIYAAAATACGLAVSWTLVHRR